MTPPTPPPVDPAHVAELDQAIAFLAGKVDGLVTSARRTTAAYGPEQAVRAVFTFLRKANHDKVAAIAAVALVRLAAQQQPTPPSDGERT